MKEFDQSPQVLKTKVNYNKPFSFYLPSAKKSDNVIGINIAPKEMINRDQMRNFSNAISTSMNYRSHTNRIHTLDKHFNPKKIIKQRSPKNTKLN